MVGDVGGGHGFGVRVEADQDADPSQAVGKARPYDKMSGLLVHDHDTHLRVINLKRSRVKQSRSAPRPEDGIPADLPDAGRWTFPRAVETVTVHALRSRLCAASPSPGELLLRLPADLPGA